MQLYVCQIYESDKAERRDIQTGSIMNIARIPRRISRLSDSLFIRTCLLRGFDYGFTAIVDLTYHIANDVLFSVARDFKNENIL